MDWTCLLLEWCLIIELNVMFHISCWANTQVMLFSVFVIHSFHSGGVGKSPKLNSSLVSLVALAAEPTACCDKMVGVSQMSAITDDSVTQSL